MASNVVSIYNILDRNIEADPTLLNKLHSELSKIISSAYSQSMNSDEGFCFKFILPTTSVLKLYELLKRYTNIDPPFLDTFFEKFNIDEELSFEIEDIKVADYLEIELKTLRNASI